MTHEHAFSFTRFLKFAARLFLIGVLLIAIGLGAGLASALLCAKTEYKKYTGTISLNEAQLASVTRISYTQDATVLGTYAAQVIETAAETTVKTKVFDAVQKELYPQESQADKLSRFLSALEVKTATNALTVSFSYDVSAASDSARAEKEALAQRVVSTYLSLCAAAIRDRHTALAEDKAFERVFSIGKVQQSYELSPAYLTSNEGASVVGRAAIGAAAGAALAAAVIFALYLCLPYIKSVRDVLPREKAAVLRSKDKSAAAALIARAKTAKARRIAILSLSADNDYLAWTNDLVDRLKSSGVSVKVVYFTAQDSEWLTSFRESEIGGAELELYFYNGDIPAIASFVASNADFSAFFVNQRRVSASVLRESVEAIANDSYGCTVIHNPNLFYVG
ncbi:MAG: hypothetical protein J6U87_02135 [Clostridia bacterium]|nr:hypothetical protein [Clostridia bacterium]